MDDLSHKTEYLCTTYEACHDSRPMYEPTSNFVNKDITGNIYDKSRASCIISDNKGSAYTKCSVHEQCDTSNPLRELRCIGFTMESIPGSGIFD